ncbi:MAG: dihydrolipoamide acetyltransferase family protein [Candidatus Micrarchaeota archaeon]
MGGHIRDCPVLGGISIATEFRFPDVGEGIHEGVIVKWHVKEGDAVKADQIIADVETDKAVVELPSPASGSVLRIGFKEGETVKVGEVLVVIGTPGEAVSAAPAKSAPQASAPQAPAQNAPSAIRVMTAHHMATPATRKLARELGVDIERIPGTGPGGRVTEDDVKKVAAVPGKAISAPVSKAVLPPSIAVTPAPGALSAMAAPRVVIEEGDQRIPLTHLRKVIAERLVFSKTHIPHACGMDFVDVTRLVEIREREKKGAEAQRVKLTFLPFIIKACLIAMKEFPKFNANFDENTNELVIKKSHNIGIAVDTPEGLMVPVIKDVDKRSIIEIAHEIEHLASAAREKKLRLDDIKGGTFSLTNVGSVGGTFSTPIINPPEVAIMGIHRIRDMPFAVDGKVRIRKVMGISMCFDHRVADGAEATAFMNIVMKHLEDPGLLIVDML